METLVIIIIVILTISIILYFSLIYKKNNVLDMFSDPYTPPCLTSNPPCVVKGGNNGTVSCDTYCKTNQNDSLYKYCVDGVDANGNQVGCQKGGASTCYCIGENPTDCSECPPIMAVYTITNSNDQSIGSSLSLLADGMTLIGKKFMLTRTSSVGNTPEYQFISGSWDVVTDEGELAKANISQVANPTTPLVNAYSVTIDIFNKSIQLINFILIERLVT